MSDEKLFSDAELEEMAENASQMVSKEFCLTDEATAQIQNTLLTLSKEAQERNKNTDGAIDEKK